MIHRAFTLIELFVVIVIIALLIAILLPAIASAQRTARQTICISRLQQFGRAYTTYAADNRSFIAALTGGDEEVDTSTGHWRHCSIQAWKIIRAVDKRGAGTPKPLPQFEDPGGAMGDPKGAFVFEQYSYLPLITYMGDKLLQPGLLCPSDKPRLTWQKIPLGMSTSSFKPTKSNNVGPAQASLQWWPYSSSYQVMPAGICPDYGLSATDNTHAYEQYQEHDQYHFLTKAPHMGCQKFEEVAFTSSKVAMGDSQQRHGRRDMFYAYDEASQPLLFWDGSVSVRATKDAKPGWLLQAVKSQTAFTPITYKPDPTFESPIVGGVFKGLKGAYRWTRGGLKGIDFGASEINTTNWN